jgi:hypothetical protein
MPEFIDYLKDQNYKGDSPKLVENKQDLIDELKLRLYPEGSYNIGS